VYSNLLSFLTVGIRWNFKYRIICLATHRNVHTWSCIQPIWCRSTALTFRYAFTPQTFLKYIFHCWWAGFFVYSFMSSQWKVVYTHPSHFYPEQLHRLMMDRNAQVTGCLGEVGSATTVPLLSQLSTLQSWCRRFHPLEQSSNPWDKMSSMCVGHLSYCCIS